MKIIECTRALAVTPEKEITTHWIYIRKRSKLPKKYEQVIVVSRVNGNQFYGIVSEVDQTERMIKVWFDLSETMEDVDNEQKLSKDR